MMKFVNDIEKQLGSIEKQLKLLLASGIANILVYSSCQKSLPTDSVASIDRVYKTLVITITGHSHSFSQ